MTPKVVRVPVQPLSADEFAPYGEVLAGRGSLRPRIESGSVSVERVRLPLGAVSRELSELAMHFSYDQVFAEVEGRMALVVVPAPSELRPDSDGSGYDVDYERAAAFALEPGDIAMVRRGTWHMTVPLTDITFVNVTRRDDDEDVTRGESARGYIATVNMTERDGRILQIEESNA